MRAPILLIGMMGSGKTRVGRELARLLGLPWVDLDRELERRFRASVARQFAGRGEAVFRRREAALLRECRRGPAAVFSTGGGVVLSAANRRLLARAATVYLAASPAVLARRLERGARVRPLLAGASGSLEARLRRLCRQRGRLYRSCARWTVLASRGGPRAVALRVRELLRASGWTPD